MSSRKPFQVAAIVGVFAVVGVGAGDSGEEFSNNLVTDLAPLLQLFGEKFAQQFMSQTTSWADNITFACAPLGIITAIVAAIRVGGPSWLKALVGRARENRGAAEIELLSSTSDEVSELWNGQAIVRTMGKPQILEVIYCPKMAKDIPESFGLFSLNDLFRLDVAEPLRKDEENHTRPNNLYSEGSDIERLNIEPSAHHRHTEKILYELQKCAPNLILNNIPEQRDIESYLWALCGLLVQFSVLAFDVWVTYSSGLKKGGQPVRTYALPFTIIGTLLLTVGMCFCSAVVEKGSKEKYWDNSRQEDIRDSNLRIMWLQREHVVSDQRFDAFSLIARGPRSRIVTSHPAQTKTQHGSVYGSFKKTGNKPGPVTLLGRKFHIPLWMYKYTIKRFESVTILGTITSLLGFALQFIGMRASHWSVSISQLIATFIMTCVRAICRRGLTVRPRAEKLIQGFEMDWVATRMADDQKTFWSHFSDDELDSKFSPDELELCRWGIAANINTDAINAWAKDSVNPPNPEVIRIRQRLGQMKNWIGPASKQAISVASSVEIVMNALFPKPTALTKLTWSLKSLGSHGEVHISVKFNKGKWTADASEIEAILSLWMFHVREEAAAREERVIREVRGGEDELHGKKQDWLRDGERALLERSIRILCPYSAAVQQNIDWWIPTTAAHIHRVQVFHHNPAKPVNEKNTYEFDPHFVIGCAPSTTADGNPIPVSSHDNRLTIKIVPKGSDQAEEITESHLAYISNTPMANLYAQHIFKAFMWAVASTYEIESLTGDVTLHQHDTLEWKRFRLENDTLQKILYGIQQTELGSAEEIHTCTIIPLAVKEKLPAVMAVFELARRHAKHHGSVQQWTEVTDIHLWLFRNFKAFNQKSPLAVKATALLLQNFGFISYTRELWKNQLHDETDLEKLRSELLAELKTADQEVLKAIAWVYWREQLDGWDNSTLKALQIEFTDEDRDVAQYPGNAYLLRSSIHNEVLSNEGFVIFRYEGRNLNAVDILERTAFHYATALERTKFLNILLHHGAIPKVKNSMDWTPLHYAAWVGNVSISWSLLQRGADVNAQDAYGMAPIHCAAKRGHEAMVTMLLESGANVHILDGSRRSTLHWAAYYGNVSIINILIALGAVVNSREYQGRTPLHLAVVALASKEETIDTLVQSKGDINRKDRDGASVLSLAARTGQANLVRLILKYPDVEINTKSGDGRTPFSWAARNGHEEVVKELLQNCDLDVNSIDRNDDNALAWASMFGHVNMVKLCLTIPKLNIDHKNQHEHTSLHWAATCGSWGVVKALLECPTTKVNINTQCWNGQTPLSSAAKYGHDEVVKILLSQPNIDVSLASTGCRTPLCWAAKKGHEGIVKALLSQPNIDANLGSVEGLTPLCWAAKKGHEGVVKALLSQPNIDVNLGTSEGWTPLCCAAQSGHEGVVKALLSQPNIDVNLGISEGWTPLCLAAQGGHEGVVKTLLEHRGTDVNSQDSHGRIALSVAANGGYIEVVRALLERPEIDVNLQHASSPTPMWWANQRQHKDIVDLLRTKGGKLE